MKHIIAIVTLLVMAGCSAPPPRFGLEQNGARKETRLPVVEPNWRLTQSLNSEAAWSTGYKFDGTAGHAGKKVLYPGGNLTVEEDYYYSGKTFVPAWDPDAGTISEGITIRYDYTTTNAPWKCFYCNKDNLAEIPLDEAERVLQSWGLKRLNY